MYQNRDEAKEKVIRFRVNFEEDESLRSFCKITKKGMSSVIREALKEYFKNYKYEKKQ